MKETCIDRDEVFVADHKAPKVPQPGERALDNPPPPIPPQLAPILMGRSLVVATRGDDRLDAPTGQPSTQRVAVIAAIGNQAVRPLARAPRLARPADRDGVEGRFEERDFRRRCRVQVCSQRSTRAIDQNHPLRALAPLGRADLEPPFFAGAKLPSAKHSSQRSLSRSLSSARKARQSFSSTPLSSQALSRRQQVLGLLYRRGSSLQGAPVHKIHRIPSKQRRSATGGCPPFGRGFGGGKCTRIASHWVWVNLRHAMDRLLFSFAMPGVMIPQPRGFETSSTAA
jgi:hypothetical protein